MKSETFRGSDDTISTCLRRSKDRMMLSTTIPYTYSPTTP